MNGIVQLLENNPLLLLFIVAAIGYPLGQINFKGVKLGVAAVLFVGISVGALSPTLKVPQMVYLLGLVLFVYCVGLAAGPAFFASLTRKGLPIHLLTVSVLVLSASLVSLAPLLGIPATMAAGLYAGALCSTPALAAVLEVMRNSGTTQDNTPIVGYSLAYPFGVAGVLLAIIVLRRLLHVDLEKEAKMLRAQQGKDALLLSRTITVTKDIGERTIDEFTHEHQIDVIFSRVRRGKSVELVLGNTVIKRGDELAVVGARDDLDLIAELLGEVSPEPLEPQLGAFDFVQMFVSNPLVTERPLKALNIPHNFHATITRVRRGDTEFVPHGTTVLHPGDRVSLIARREEIAPLYTLFGDSYQKVSELDVSTFSLGLALGLAVGLLSVQFLGISLKLGVAGGPLIVAMLLSRLPRMGPLVWMIPYSANLTLRQIGLVVFLAGVGIEAGYSFVSTLSSGEGTVPLLLGAAMTFVSAFLTILLGYKVCRVPFSTLMGTVAGVHTQAAVLGFATNATGNELPQMGYATAFPIATITKIIIAQLILSLLH